MEQRDLITTPIVIMLVLMGAYLVRPYVTDNINRRYFFPALFVKIVGAISVGLIYQFYYNGGDTFMYHTYGSRLVWATFFDSPFKGITLLLRKSGDYTDVYEYASRIYFFKDPSSYSLVRLASVFDLLTLSSYAATSVLFACFGFVGIWSLYLTFYQQYPWLHRNLLRVGSDDGSALFIDGKKVADADGTHPHTVGEGRVTLTKGFHPIRVDYFQGGGEWTLEADIEGPGLPRQPIHPFVSKTPESAVAPEPEKKPEGFVLNDDLVKQGRELFSHIPNPADCR